MGNVPNTTTFTFLDVYNAISAHPNDLISAFELANTSGFDSTYKGSKNSLLNFRNYADTQDPPTMNMSGFDMGILSTAYQLNVGSASGNFSYTPSGMSTSPHTNYYEIWKDSSLLWTASRSNCRNGVSIDNYNFSLSENVQYNTTYTLYIYYNAV